MLRQQSQKLRFVGAAMLFFTHASFYTLEKYVAYRYQQSLFRCINCQRRLLSTVTSHATKCLLL